MTKNINLRNAAREYQAANPGTTFPDAKRAVELEWAERRAARNVEIPLFDPAPIPDLPLFDRESSIVEAISGMLSTIMGKELSNGPDTPRSRDQWRVDLDPVLEAPIQILDLKLEPGTLDFQVHEVLDDGGELGEARITGTMTYDACVSKADAAAATGDEDWWIDTANWNRHYALVNGEVQVELIANVIINGPEEIEVRLMGVETVL